MALALTFLAIGCIMYIALCRSSSAHARESIRWNGRDTQMNDGTWFSEYGRYYEVAGANVTLLFRIVILTLMFVSVIDSLML